MLACAPSGLALLGISAEGKGKNFPQSINRVKVISAPAAVIKFLKVSMVRSITKSHMTILHEFRLGFAMIKTQTLWFQLN
jgi:hypothetical protein